MVTIHNSILKSPADVVVAHGKGAEVELVGCELKVGEIPGRHGMFNSMLLLQPCRRAGNTANGSRVALPAACACSMGL